MAIGLRLEVQELRELDQIKTHLASTVSRVAHATVDFTIPLVVAAAGAAGRPIAVVEAAG